MSEGPILALEEFAFSTDSSVFEIGDVTIRAGDRVGLVHPSSLDRVAFTNTILGLQEPAEGEARILGKTVSKIDRVAGPLRWQVGWSQDPPLFLSNVPLDDNLALPLRYHTDLPEEDIQARISACKKQVGLTESLRLTPMGYPYYILRLASLARAMAPEGRLLVIENVERTILENAHRERTASVLDQWNERGGAVILMTSQAKSLLGFTEDWWIVRSNGSSKRASTDQIRQNQDHEIRQLLSDHSSSKTQASDSEESQESVSDDSPSSF